MSQAFSIGTFGPDRWVDMGSGEYDPTLEDRCTREMVEGAIAGLPGASVVSVTLNTSGKFKPPPPVVDLPMAPEVKKLLANMVVEDLPPYCDVRINQVTPGGHVAEVVVWVPLIWNGRMLGLGGGGNRTEPQWFSPIQGSRGMTPGTVVSNGFVAVFTDAGNRDPRFAGWGLDPETRSLDIDLIENWVHRSTHEMTAVGRTVTEAIHGDPPAFSYFVGASGGGRQALEEAQRYPDDYDGIWSIDPAINWSMFIPAEIWPVLVMNELDNPVPAAKLDAFRQAVLAAAGDPSGRFVPTLEPSVFDPYSLVGTDTEAGTITTRDADVVRMIWDGPHTPDGERLWFGLRPSTESWGNNAMQAGLAVTIEGDHGLEPFPFLIAEAYIGQWMKRDPNWDWRTLTTAEFANVFAASQREFSWLDSNATDLSSLRERGSKLLVTHGLADEVIFPEGTQHWYDRVLEDMGGIEQTAPFARLFLAPGDGHAHTGAGGTGGNDGQRYGCAHGVG